MKDELIHLQLVDLAIHRHGSAKAAIKFIVEYGLYEHVPAGVGVKLMMIAIAES